MTAPLPVTATFAFGREDGATLDGLARLDTMVTVVDATGVLPELNTGDEPAGRGLHQYDDEQTISDLLTDQAGFADVIILNKTSLITQDHADSLAATLARLNPAARALRAVTGMVPPGGRAEHRPVRPVEARRRRDG